MTYDVVVVGGGIAGLWVARHAVKAGLSVAVVDKAACGSGASSTVLGALLPHLPRVMSAKKAFQFDALAELSGLVAELEDETGVSAGYARCGRVMPIRTSQYLAHAKLCCDGAVDGWRSAETGLSVDVCDALEAAGWIDPEAAPLGIIRDNMSARVLAEDYMAALKASLAGRATLIEGVT
ncbi:MAG: FAD-dependent oxidoreductase, partial [Hyphomicrobiaceae bacterium]